VSKHLVHRGYIGRAWADFEAGVFRGEVVNIRDTITFQGKDTEELAREFRESVEDYLEFCRSRGEEPNKPFSGRLPIRIKPEVHRSLSMAAKMRNQSLNKFVAGCLARAAKRAERRVAGQAATEPSRTKVAGKPDAPAGKRKRAAKAPGEVMA
jgi:predicted HicB family RNase H-like nuclease